MFRAVPGPFLPSSTYFPFWLVESGNSAGGEFPGQDKGKSSFINFHSFSTFSAACKFVVNRPGELIYNVDFCTGEETYASVKLG